MKTIAISLSPNVFQKDIWIAIKTILSPWSYNARIPTLALETWFKKFFSVSYAFSYTSGRAGLYEVLSAYGIEKGDEVILQAFTCVALPNAIISLGATPIYADIDDTLTVSPADLEKKVTKKTKAIIMQHTFGIPSHAEKICAIARKYKIPVIEDCAHGIGTVYKEKLLGTYGDVSFFSFGRDKAFSSVFGGMVITNDKNIAEKLQKSYEKIPLPSYLWTTQQLFHPIAFSIILACYDFLSIGKLLLVLLQKLHLLSFPVTAEEKKGVYKKSDVKRLPGALAGLASLQLKRIELFNKKRMQYAQLYIKQLPQFSQNFPVKENVPYLRFPMLLEKRDDIINSLKKQRVYIGKWYANVIDPKGTDFNVIKYQKGSCPKAEWVAERILNLPTMPRLQEKDVQYIVTLLRKYV